MSHDLVRFMRVKPAGALILMALVFSSCGPALPVQEAKAERFRLQRVTLDPEHDAEGILRAVETRGSYDHVVLTHTPAREEVLFETWDAELVTAAVGQWNTVKDGPAPQAILTWASEAEVGEVELYRNEEGRVSLFRLADRIAPGDRFVEPLLPAWLEGQAPSLEEMSRLGDVALVVGSEEIRRLLVADAMLGAEQWNRRGPRWVKLARALDSEALGMHVLVLWGRSLEREHRLREAAVPLEEVLKLADRHRLSERARALLTRDLAEIYGHSLAPFEALGLLRDRLDDMRGEGLYILLCTLGEQLEDLGLLEEASRVVDQAADISERVRHVHGPNHRLIQSRLYLAQDRLEEALEEARAASTFALQKMHFQDHIFADLQRARIYLAMGRLDDAEHLARTTAERARASWQDGSHVCTFPALHVLHGVMRRRGNQQALLDLEQRMLEETRRFHSVLTASERYSMLAAELFEMETDRGLSLLRRAFELRERAGVDHIARGGQLQFLSWSLRTNRERELSDQVANDLFSRFEEGRRYHVPVLLTPAKQAELETYFTLLDYFMARGDTERVTRVAERVIAANVLRSLLVLTIHPTRLQTLDLVPEPIPTSTLDPHYHEGLQPSASRSGPERGDREELKSLVEGLIDRLEGLEPYPYEELLGPGDLYLAYMSRAERLYLLSWFEGEVRVRLLSGGGGRPMEQVHRLLPSATRLGGSGTRSLQAYRAAEALSRVLLGSVQEELSRADRLVISPGPALQSLPFGLLPVGPRFLGETLPIVYVDTGLPLGTGQIQGAPDASRDRIHLIGDPFSDLPTTRSMLQAFGAELPAARVWTGAEATEGKVWEPPSPPRILHLDTHAVLEDWKGLRMVAVRLAPEEQEDGNLLLGEWLERMGSVPEIVSIVACRSGVAASDELQDIGQLGAALAARGVPWSLTTFWRVGDEASACFVPHWLHRVVGRQSPDRALQQAILSAGRDCGSGGATVWGAYRLSIAGSSGAEGW